LLLSENLVNWLASISWPVNLLRLHRPSLSNLLLSPWLYLGPSCFSFIENFKKSAYALMVSWISLTLSSRACSFLMRSWIVKNNLYFANPLSRPPHNGISSVMIMGSFLPHTFLSSSLYIFSSHCIWSNTLTKYSEIFSYSSICNFLKSPRNFCRRTFFTLSTP